MSLPSTSELRNDKRCIAGIPEGRAGFCCGTAFLKNSLGQVDDRKYVQIATTAPSSSQNFAEKFHDN